MTSKLDYARQYALDGKKVFPCKPNGKAPLTRNGFKDASSNVEDIEAWWDTYPGANIGLVTGRDNNLVVIDVDVKNGAKGRESSLSLFANGIKFDTKIVGTPSEGWHYYYQYPGNIDSLKSRVNVLPGIDVRADGGYVLAPGSEIDGQPYYFKNTEEDKPILEMPELLLDIISQVPEGSAISTGASVKQGSRNDHIFRLASKMRGDDVPLDEAKSQVLLEAHICVPPLPESEAIKCLESAYERYQPNSKNPTDVGNAKRLVELFGDNLRYISEFKKWIYWS